MISFLSGDGPRQRQCASPSRASSWPAWERRLGSGHQPGCDTVYDVMSMTKQFTAAAILKLQMMGMLEVGDPVSEYLDPVPGDKRADHAPPPADAHLGVGRRPRRRLRATTRVTRWWPGPVRSASSSPETVPLLEPRLQPARRDHRARLRLWATRSSSRRSCSGRPDGPRRGTYCPDWSRRRRRGGLRRQGQPRAGRSSIRGPTTGPAGTSAVTAEMLSTARDMYRWHLALEGDEILDERSKELLFDRTSRRTR